MMRVNVEYHVHVCTGVLRNRGDRDGWYMGSLVVVEDTFKCSEKLLIGIRRVAIDDVVVKTDCRGCMIPPDDAPTFFIYLPQGVPLSTGPRSLWKRYTKVF